MNCIEIDRRGLGNTKHLELSALQTTVHVPTYSNTCSFSQRKKSFQSLLILISLQYRWSDLLHVYHQIRSAYIEEFLRYTATLQQQDDTTIFDLLWKYYEKNRNYLAAAKILDQLAHRTRQETHMRTGTSLFPPPQELTLNQRGPIVCIPSCTLEPLYSPTTQLRADSKSARSYMCIVLHCLINYG